MSNSCGDGIVKIPQFQYSDVALKTVKTCSFWAFADHKNVCLKQTHRHEENPEENPEQAILNTINKAIKNHRG